MNQTPTEELLQLSPQAKAAIEHIMLQHMSSVMLSMTQVQYAIAEETVRHIHAQNTGITMQEAATNEPNAS